MEMAANTSNFIVQGPNLITRINFNPGITYVPVYIIVFGGVRARHEMHRSKVKGQKSTGLRQETPTAIVTHVLLIPLYDITIEQP